MEFTRARAAAWCAGKGKPPPTGATGNGLPNNNCRYWFLAKPRFRLSSPFLSWLVPFQLSCQESNTAMLFKTHNLFSGFCVSNLSQKSGIFFRSRIVVFCCEIFSMQYMVVGQLNIVLLSLKFKNTIEYLFRACYLYYHYQCQVITFSYVRIFSFNEQFFLQKTRVDLEIKMSSYLSNEKSDQDYTSYPARQLLKFFFSNRETKVPSQQKYQL